MTAVFPEITIPDVPADEFLHGQEWLPDSQNHETAPEELKRLWAFQDICIENNFSRKNTKDRIITPPLFAWVTHGQWETFVVGLYGPQAEHYEQMAATLLAVRGACGVSVRRHGDRAGIWEITLNHLVLPTDDEFDFDKASGSQDRVYVGPGENGQDMFINLASEAPHGLIVGASGSGKSYLALSMAHQFHEAGGELVIISPKYEDPKFTVFRELGHKVILGKQPEHREAFFQWAADEVAIMGDREHEKAEEGHELYQGNRRLIIIDEYGFWTKVVDASDKELAAAMKKAANDVTTIAQQSRETLQNLVLLTQQPYAQEFGGSNAILFRLLVWRVAVRALDKQFWPDVFGHVSAAISNVLGNEKTPPGRAVGKGLLDGIAPMAMQVSYLSIERCRDRLLGKSDVIDVEEAQPVDGRPAPTAEDIDPMDRELQDILTTSEGPPPGLGESDFAPLPWPSAEGFHEPIYRPAPIMRLVTVLVVVLFCLPALWAYGVPGVGMVLLMLAGSAALFAARFRVWRSVRLTPAGVAVFAMCSLVLTMSMIAAGALA